jgi:hypothetical protein
MKKKRSNYFGIVGCLAIFLLPLLVPALLHLFSPKAKQMAIEEAKKREAIENAPRDHERQIAERRTKWEGDVRSLGTPDLGLPDLKLSDLIKRFGPSRPCINPGQANPNGDLRGGTYSDWDCVVTAVSAIDTFDVYTLEIREPFEGSIRGIRPGNTMEAIVAYGSHHGYRVGVAEDGQTFMNLDYPWRLEWSRYVPTNDGPSAVLKIPEEWPPFDLGKKKSNEQIEVLKLINQKYYVSRGAYR